MRTIKIFVFLFTVIILWGCGQQLSESYHMDKKYWDVNDYEEAIRHIKYSLTNDEGYPRLSDPLTAPVFMKLTDKQNVSVVLEDDQLGIKHKNEVATAFFKTAKEIYEIYYVLDKQDKFIYPMELVKTIDFFLYTQIQYFKIGNDEILKDAINPDDIEIQRVLKKNEDAVVGNFNINLELLTKEDAFNETAIDEYASIIDIYYNKLIEEFTMADYSSLKNTADMIISKVKSATLKKSLTRLIEKIEEKQKDTLNNES